MGASWGEIAEGADDARAATCRSTWLSVRTGPWRGRLDAQGPRGPRAYTNGDRHDWKDSCEGREAGCCDSRGKRPAGGRSWGSERRSGLQQQPGCEPWKRELPAALSEGDLGARRPGGLRTPHNCLRGVGPAQQLGVWKPERRSGMRDGAGSDLHVADHAQDLQSGSERSAGRTDQVRDAERQRSVSALAEQKMPEDWWRRG